MDPQSFEAYCLDEAVIFFGMQLETMLENVGHKPSKDERRAKAAREALIDKIFAEEGDDQKKSAGFADPAAMFS